MSNSPLATYTKLSPNCTAPRNSKIDTITIHCVVGQFTAKEICNLSMFTTYNKTKGASCNYAVGRDGSIGLCVEEKNRSWCTSSKSNDHRAVTIEVASDKVHPYAVTDEAYNALVELVADICKRNNIKELKWQGDKSLVGQIDKQNMTVHRWFANKACPGEYLYSRHFQIAEAVNKKNAKEEKNMPKTVYSINDVHVQVILPDKFKIKVVDEQKLKVDETNYVNAGFFANADTGTVPVGHLVIDGQTITNAKTQADWLNTARQELTTIVVYDDYTVGMIKTADIESIPGIKYAISGIPIIRNGYKVSMDEIKSEGYFGNECYWTWHGFLGVRHGKLVYVAAETDFEMMPYLMEVLGITDAIKLDGGGSFILHNGEFEIATAENRRDNNIITWEG